MLKSIVQLCLKLCKSRTLAKLLDPNTHIWRPKIQQVCCFALISALDWSSDWSIAAYLHFQIIRAVFGPPRRQSARDLLLCKRAQSPFLIDQQPKSENRIKMVPLFVQLLHKSAHTQSDWFLCIVWGWQLVVYRNTINWVQLMLEVLLLIVKETKQQASFDQLVFHQAT